VPSTLFQTARINPSLNIPLSITCLADPVFQGVNVPVNQELAFGLQVDNDGIAVLKFVSLAETTFRDNLFNPKILGKQFTTPARSAVPNARLVICPISSAVGDYFSGRSTNSVEKILFEIFDGSDMVISVRFLAF